MKKTSLFLLACATLIAAGCHRGAQEDPQPAQAVEVRQPNEFRLAHPDQFPLVAVTSARLPDTVEVPGTIAPVADRVIPIYSPLPGRILRLNAQLGFPVRAGQPLAVIASADLQQAYSDYAKAQAAQQLAQKEAARTQLLVQHGAAAARDLDAAQTALSQVRADTAAARTRLLQVGADPDHPTDTLIVRAPRSGVVVDLASAPGSYLRSLDSSTPLMTIADLSQVWAVADVHEDQLARIARGDTAQIHGAAFPGRVFTGTVAQIASVLDPATRTAGVRIVLANPGGLLKPQMFVRVDLISRQLRPSLIAPATAIVRTQDQSWTFLARGNGLFQKVPVSTGRTQGDQVEILQGLHSGDRIVRDALRLDADVAIGSGN